MAARRRHYGRPREGSWRRRIAAVLVLVTLAAVITLGWIKLEGARPTAELAAPVTTLGIASTVQVRVSDRGTGLRWSRAELEAAGKRVEVAREEYPATSWRGSGRRQAMLDLALAPRELGLPEGPATLRVYGDDYSWRRWFRTLGPLLEQPLQVDTTPPRLEALSHQHYLTLGGVELALYRTSDDATESGVAVGSYFFPGTAGLFADQGIQAALFAVPQDLGTDARPTLLARDAAGNQREVTFHTSIKPRRFAERTIRIDDAFLERKVPEILAANGLPSEPDLVAGYLYINGTLRKTSEARIRELTRTSAARPLWDGAFLRQPNSAPLSGFGDRRSYVYEGKEIDRQTHLGFDLASLRQSPVPCVADGQVVHAGLLGIYGEAVIVDHGLGLFSLYGHLSSVAVTAGDAVQRGDVLGRTGETGLAGGDHLHFSVMLWGVHVDPVEWWDGGWIRDHVTAKLETFPRATQTARGGHEP